MNDAIVHFTLGVSPLVTVFPFVVLMSAHAQMSDDERQASRVSLSTLVIALPVAFGVTMAIMYACLGFVPRKLRDVYVRFVLSGAMTGLVIGIALQVGLRIHEDWLEVDNPVMCHIATFAFYLVFFYTIGQWVRYQVLYGPPPSKSSSSSSSVSSSSSTSTPKSSSSVLEKMAIARTKIASPIDAEKLI